MRGQDSFYKESVQKKGKPAPVADAPPKTPIPPTTRKALLPAGFNANPVDPESAFNPVTGQNSVWDEGKVAWIDAKTGDALPPATRDEILDEAAKAAKAREDAHGREIMRLLGRNETAVSGGLLLIILGGLLLLL